MLFGGVALQCGRIPQGKRCITHTHGSLSGPGWGTRQRPIQRTPLTVKRARGLCTLHKTGLPRPHPQRATGAQAQSEKPALADWFPTIEGGFWDMEYHLSERERTWTSLGSGTSLLERGSTLFQSGIAFSERQWAGWAILYLLSTLEFLPAWGTGPDCYLRLFAKWQVRIPNLLGVSGGGCSRVLHVANPFSYWETLMLM